MARYKNTKDPKKASAQEEAKPGFAGTAADPKLKTLPKHTGEKIRHKNRPAGSKITRKDLRKQEQDRKDPKKRKLAAAERKQAAAAAQAEVEPPAKKQKKLKPAKKLGGEDKRDQKENKEFDLLVTKYRNQFATNQTVVKKWFDT